MPPATSPSAPPAEYRPASRAASFASLASAGVDTDVIVVGAGLAGLVATAEIADAGRRVLLLDQESEQSLGGQAFWSFGGLLMVDTPEQRRLRVRDSHDLALKDWLAYAGFDRDEDVWPRRWAEAYVDFASGEMRAWLHAMGMRWFPLVQWAERRGCTVPRFHITWGTGPAVIEPFVRRVRAHIASGRVRLWPRHRVAALLVEAGSITGVSGDMLAASSAERGVETTRDVVGEFTLRAGAVVISSGGIGANHDLVRAYWPARLGTPPRRLLSGVFQQEHRHAFARRHGSVAGQQAAQLDEGDRPGVVQHGLARAAAHDVLRTDAQRTAQRIERHAGH